MLTNYILKYYLCTNNYSEYMDKLILITEIFDRFYIFYPQKIDTFINIIWLNNLCSVD
jgi:hypothetical protein